MRGSIKSLLVFTVLLLALFAGTSSASALSSWWSFTAAQRPTNLQPGTARDEVQELTVKASKGNLQAFREETRGSVEVPFNASHEALQGALEGLYGSGNVQVTGGPGDATGSHPYIVTFGGALADQPIREIVSNGSAATTVARVAPGRPDGQIVLFAENVGDGVLDATSNPVQLADVLPAGLTAVGISATQPESEGVTGRVPLACSIASLTCTFTGTLAPYDELEVRIDVLDTGGLPAEPNRATVSGGQAPSASVARTVTAGEPAPFGVEDYSFSPEEEGGAPVTKAGSHPFQLTTTVALSQEADMESLLAHPKVEPVALAKDVNVKLPAGMVGNPTVLQRCPMTQFLTVVVKGRFGGDECPADTAVGVATVVINEPTTIKGAISFTQPVFDLEPGYGEPARFGFYVAIVKTPVILDTALRSGAGEDYGITVSAMNIPETAGFLSSTVTFWGTPGDPRHDDSRGWGCLEATRGGEGFPCTATAQNQPPPVLTLPTSCAGPLQSSVSVDSWLHPAEPVAADPSTPMGMLDGCGRLSFKPSFEAVPTTRSASAPSGLDVNIDFHDEGLTSGEGLSESHLKDTTVVLPEGFTINPSAGVGLVGCTTADYARETLSSLPGAGCPNESKLGTVEIETPLLTQKIKGSLFIAQPYENPFGSLVALYVVAKNPETGVIVKLAGKVVLDPVTGRLTTRFDDNPQLPFDHFNFHFREGAQAPLIAPSTCGTFTTRAAMTPWSEPTRALIDTSSFTITKGYDGGACPSGGAPPFRPGIVSGTLDNNAGAFSPFYLHLTRTDGDQEISGFSTNMPSGLTGDLTGIPFCPDGDIEAARQKSGAQEEASPSCPAASRIGHTLVGTGVGAVLAYVPGKVYLAGPFHGAPFSLVSVTSAVVGPFDIGTVVLRFGLNIDPNTAQVNVSPTSSEPIPTILRGIVTHVRDIRVYIDRPGFILNPTSCNPLAISSTLSGDQGATATVSSPFQAANCANLAFKPTFKVSTSGKTSRQNGASLHVALSYPKDAFGKDANIKYVKVNLPKQLPSELRTLQHACPHEVFEANPAGCSSASRVGTAKAITPILPVPIEGPAYFVSYGGEQFPELIVVLQGYGVTIDLHGETFINEKTGITSSTFKTVPDQPVTSFELNLPQGPFSALGANGNLCEFGKTVVVTKRVRRKLHGRVRFVRVKVKKKRPGLVMPTRFVAQNGAEVKQNTPISVSQCPRAKKAGAHKARRARGRH